MLTLTVAFAETCPVLFGRRSFSAFGLTSVEVTRKKISNRNTMSVIEDIDISDSDFVVLFIAISRYSSVDSAGSWRRSMKPIVVLSILKTRSEILEVR